MYLLVVHCDNRGVRFIGPFPTFFRANEYAKDYCVKELGYVAHDVIPLERPATLRVKFK